MAIVDLMRVESRLLILLLILFFVSVSCEARVQRVAISGSSTVMPLAELSAEEFNLLQAALNIEDGIENLRYNNVVVATDADVDGMHIRLLLLTFFLQFFPDLVRKGHVYILQTPLFRVRNKKETRYCYSADEKVKAIAALGPNPEMTRFKGLGEISPDEFKHFIGKDMRLEPVRMKKNDSVNGFLEFFMGKNTPDRQDFIIENLRIEEDIVEEGK